MGRNTFPGRGQRPDYLGRHAHDEVALLVRPGGVTEKPAQVRDVAEVRHLLNLGNLFVENEAGNDERLPVLETRHRLRAARDEGWNGKTEELDAVCVVRLGDLGFHDQFDVVAANDGRNELDRGAEGFKDDGGVERLRNYDRNLATREELGFLTGVGQQMRLRKHFAEVVSFEELEESLQRIVRVLCSEAVSETRRQQERDYTAAPGQDSGRVAASREGADAA